VCTEEIWIEADTGDPIGQEPRVLPGRHALICTATAIEQEFSGFLQLTFK
jgi:hypothetical protein